MYFVYAHLKTLGLKPLGFAGDSEMVVLVVTFQQTGLR
jgi:hypothetical protein